MQQQDGSSDDAPVFEVTYVNEHNHVDVPGNKSLPPPTTGQQPSIKAAVAVENGGGAVLDFLEENAAIVSCLATVISGAAPGAPPADGKRTPGADDGAMSIDAGFWWNEDPSPSSLWPTDTELMMTDLREDVHMGAARFVDGTVWQQYDT